MHIAHWRITGRSLAPLELNEVMVTLELGIVTAGFLFMAVILLATTVLGRFFCSWACHILALEDLCSWLLAKVGIRPRPIRSRALLLVPSGTMFYMFIWPQVQRWIVGRELPRLRLQEEGGRWASFVTDDFWRNLPPVWVALVTFAVCGFVMVYVLGSRSFCRYACPYGAVFGLADRIAPGRIVALDGCTSCGKCTAGCQSDIRVHEELAAFGTVLSSSCLKDLDCLDACPSSAIGFGFTKPALFRSRLSKQDQRPRKTLRPPYDFSPREDLGMSALFLTSLWILRGLYGWVPFLLALALSGLYAYMGAIAWRLVRRRDVKIARRLLKSAGRLRRSGRAFRTTALCLGLLWIHSGLIRTQEWLGGHAEGEAAIRHYERVQSLGLATTPKVDRALVDLYLASARPERALGSLRRELERHPEQLTGWLQLARIYLRMGQAGQARQALAFGLRLPHANSEHDLAVALRAAGELLARDWQLEEGAAFFASALELEPDSAAAHFNLAVLFSRVGRTGEALEHYRVATELDPEDAEILNNLGFLLAVDGQSAEAELCFRKVLALEEDFAAAHFNLGHLLFERGDAAEAQPHLQRAANLDTRYAQTPDPAD